MPPPDPGLQDGLQSTFMKLKALFYIAVSGICIMFMVRFSIKVLINYYLVWVYELASEGTLDAFSDAPTDPTVLSACSIVVALWACLMIVIVASKFFESEPTIAYHATRDNHGNVVVEIPNLDIHGFSVNEARDLLKLRYLEIEYLKGLNVEELRARGTDVNKLERLIGLSTQLLVQVNNLVEIAQRDLQLRESR